MKTITDIITSIIRRDPNPTGRPAPLLNQSDVPPRNKGGIPTMQRMTKETLNQIIQAVDNDPLAGMGSMSKRDILIDRLLAHWNTVEAPTTRAVVTPSKIISEPSKSSGGGSLTQSTPSLPQNAVKTA